MANNLPIGIGTALVRVSSEKQDTERQRLDIQAWLDRHGLKVEARWYEDKGARDDAENRPDFQALLNRVRRREIKWIVIQSTDRLGYKDAYELGEFISIFRKHGCQLWTSKDGECISESDPKNIFTNAVAGLASSQEQMEKSNRSQSTRMRDGNKGNYQGGIIPHGCDLICYSTRGVEMWRHVVTGKGNRGFMVDDRGETRDVDKVPPHDYKTSYLQLAPSIKTERIDTVKRIYRLFLNESTTPGRIARTLNAEKVDAVTSDRWTDPKIRQLIGNPCYIGRPASGKRSNAKFLEMRGGVQTPAPRIETRKPKGGRPQARSDWAMPDQPIFDPIIDVETWELANAKVSTKKRRAPRNDCLYLAGLMVCSGCGRLMTGCTFKEDRRPSYICATRNTLGKDNPTGCRFNRVQPFQIDGLIEQYLDDSGIRLQELLNSRRDPDGLDRLLSQDHGVNVEIDALTDKMRSFISEQTGIPIDDVISDFSQLASDVDVEQVEVALRSQYPDMPPVAFETMMDALHPELIRMGSAGHLRRLYESVRGTRLDTVRSQLDGAEQDYANQFDLFATLKAGSKAAEKGAERLESLESKIAHLKMELEPLHESFDALMDGLVELREHIAEARVAFAKGSDRMKAEALRGCIARIVCFSEPHAATRTRLVAIEIVPKIGDSRRFTLDAMRVHDQQSERGDNLTKGAMHPHDRTSDAMVSLFSRRFAVESRRFAECV
jgi:DNA invertase Pin-like site-specific DNA recombinase